MTTLELLAPAKNLECGIAAIDHGADAVYIGAPRFGARAAAGNTVDDIRQLCDYAHRFLAKVYVTLNTIVYDHELPQARLLTRSLCEAGVDAILVQDMAMLGIVRETAEECRSTMQAHASTQTDNRTAHRVEWLRDRRFSRVVLARELSPAQIADIHDKVPDVQLEAFVHGALCVSYSGVCYASQYCFQRSANRGECAQFCRLRFALVDAAGRTVAPPRYWLSLKDMCRIDQLRLLAEAGVTSFKIEGRLKGVEYVKNVVAAYSQQLDKIIAQAPEGTYRRSAIGHAEIHFVPDLRKTFNRGFTHYYPEMEKRDIASPDTPKALGEYVGKVKEIRGRSFSVAGLASFANGDGLCFFDDTQQLRGFRVNRVEANRIFPQQMPGELRPGMGLYRNVDAVFERLLHGRSGVRRIPVTMHLSAWKEGIRLDADIVGTDIHVETCAEIPLEKAMRPQEENMRTQLAKLGNTPYRAESIVVDADVATVFVPSSILSTLRRDMVEQLDAGIARCADTRKGEDTWQREKTADTRWAHIPVADEYSTFSYLYNIANEEARRFYVGQGKLDVSPSFEQGNHGRADGRQEPLLMQCRYCIRYLLGYCTKEGKKAPWREPLYLQLPDNRRFRLEFDCKKCQCNVYGEK